MMPDPFRARRPYVNFSYIAWFIEKIVVFLQHE